MSAALHGFAPTDHGPQLPAVTGNWHEPKEWWREGGKERKVGREKRREEEKGGRESTNQWESGFNNLCP